MRIFILVIIILSSAAFVKAQIDTTLKAYYPLKDGNYWEYTDDYNLANSRVMGDTIMPNTQGYKVLKNIDNWGTTYYNFLRIDDSMNVWKYLENFSCNEELLLFKLNLPDRSIWKECFISAALDSALNFPCVYETRLKYYIVLQQAAITKSFCGAVIDTVSKDTSFCGSFYFTKYDLAKNFGPVFMAGGGTVLWLSGAIIDGIQYGQILLDIRDESIHPDNFNLSVFPNPFNGSCNVEVTNSTNGRLIVEIYNVIGEKIHTLYDEYSDAGKINLRFDSQSIANNVPSGFYILRAVLNDQNKNAKILLLK